MSRKPSSKDASGRRAPPAPRSIGHYTLGESIGKGGFGTVYRGLNTETGDFVAIKQVSLTNIPKEELANIMTEIDLLKKLKHNNIVKYLGFIKTKEHLNILLEYVDCGSLANVIKKFGAIPEQLVSIYIEQVLVGLQYLHEQGVIHRDVKGANILTSSAGHVKLADFGVATKLGAAELRGAERNCVVGSAYWMAPEVIEMSAPSTASDIWSVGCTVIELLTGAPPYFELAPMPALFRIVQDDMPPLPDTCSAALKDFLQQCFQKDANLRVSAQQLLRHQWIANRNRAKRPVPALPSAGGSGAQWGDAALHEMIGRTIELRERNSSGEYARPGPALAPPAPSSRRRPHGPPAEHRGGPPAPPHEVGGERQREARRAPRSHPRFPSRAGDGPGAPPSPARAALGHMRSGSFSSRSAHGGAAYPASVQEEDEEDWDREIEEEERSGAPAGPSAFALRSAAAAAVDERGAALSSRTSASAATDRDSIPSTTASLPTEPLPPFRFRRPSLGPYGAAPLPGSGLSSIPMHAPPLHARTASLDTAWSLLGQPLAAPSPARPPPHGHAPDGSDRPPARHQRPASVSASASPMGSPRQRVSSRGSLGPGRGQGGAPGLLAYAEGAEESYDDFVSDDGEAVEARIRQRHDLKPRAKLQLIRPEDMRYLDPLLRAPPHLVKQDSQKLAQGQDTEEGYDDLLEGEGPLEPPALEAPGGAGRGAPSDSEPDDEEEEDEEEEDDEDDYDECSDGEREAGRAGRRRHGRRRVRPGEETPRGAGAGAGPESEAGGSVRGGALALRHDLERKLREKMSRDWDEAAGGGGAGDPFDVDLDEEPDAGDGEAGRTDVYGAAGGEVVKLIATLQPSESEEVILAACAKLVGIFREQPLAKGHLITHRGVIPIMEMLDTENARILHAVLQVVNQIIEDNGEFKENLCLVGVIPLVMRFAAPSQPADVRLQAAQFVRQMCAAPAVTPGSSLTLQMFIACKGLPTLVSFLEAPYSANAALVRLAIDGVWRVFELQSPTPKNDFCRLFAKCGLLERLVAVMLSILDEAPLPARHPLLDGPRARPDGEDGTDEEVAGEGEEGGSGRGGAEWEGALERIADLFLLFSHADSIVKAYMSTPQVLRRVVRALSARGAPASVLVKLLRCVKNLSLDPNALEPLQRAGALAPLVRFLAAPDGPHVNEVHNQVLNTLYNLCKINRGRQEQAAVAGVVPHLMRIIERNSPLKQFAIPVLCDLAHAGRRARAELWRHRALEFYLSLLTVPDCWQVNAIDAVARLLALFRAPSQASLARILEPFDRIIKVARRVNEALGESELVSLLLAPLPRADARVRVNLLKTVLDLHAAAPDRRGFAARHGLPGAVRRVVADERAVLVVELADKLCRLCEADLAEGGAATPRARPPTPDPAASPAPLLPSPWSGAAPALGRGPGPRRRGLVGGGARPLLLRLPRPRGPARGPPLRPGRRAPHAAPPGPPRHGPPGHGEGAAGAAERSLALESSRGWPGHPAGT
eukprot:tig00001307_g8118.t1